MEENENKEPTPENETDSNPETATGENAGQDILKKEVTPGSPGPMGGEGPANEKQRFMNLKDILDDIKKETDTMKAGLSSLLKAPILDNPTNNASITEVESDILMAASSIGLAGGIIYNAIGRIQRELEPAGSNKEE